MNPDFELRRWCIEQAIKWPYESAGLGNYAAGIGMPSPRTEVDIIGRAEKLYAWVTLCRFFRRPVLGEFPYREGL